MAKFLVHRGSLGADYTIYGESLVRAIQDDFKVIASRADVGNAAGYILKEVVASYSPSILGRQGGVELVIKWHGQALAHRPAPTQIQTTTVWIEASQSDLPEPHVFVAKGDSDA